LLRFAKICNLQKFFITNFFTTCIFGHILLINFKKVNYKFIESKIYKNAIQIYEIIESRKNLTNINYIAVLTMAELFRINSILNRFSLRSQKLPAEYIEKFMNVLSTTEKYSTKIKDEYQFLYTPFIGNESLSDIGPPQKREVIFFAFIKK